MSLNFVETHFTANGSNAAKSITKGLKAILMLLDVFPFAVVRQTGSEICLSQCRVQDFLKWWRCTASPGL